MLVFLRLKRRPADPIIGLSCPCRVGIIFQQLPESHGHLWVIPLLSEGQSFLEESSFGFCRAGIVGNDFVKVSDSSGKILDLLVEKRSLKQSLGSHLVFWIFIYQSGEGVHRRLIVF